MNLNDLNNGMAIELEDGKRFLVVRGKDDKYFGFIGKETYFLSDAYDENMKAPQTPKLDCVKVYEIVKPLPFDIILNDKNLELIWERRDESKLEEAKRLLAEYYGKPIKHIVVV
jgi:hypothetical protein